MIRVASTSLWVSGGPEGLLADLLAGTPRPAPAPEPDRPARVAAGPWRRMSRLTRMVVATAAPLLEGREDLDTLPVIWGNTMGELVPVGRFLDRLYGEGPQACSPLAFQNSVTNAPVGHLSIGMGLRGPSETLSAGGASGLTALMRGVDLLRLGRAPAVLVVAGDDLNEHTRRAWDHTAEAPALGEAMAAVILCTDEPTLASVPGSVAPELSLGMVPAGGLAWVVALVQAGRTGSVVDQDGPMILTARVLESP
jgi:3-oxoacyl-(acyl-carrier-protein) synthase